MEYTDITDEEYDTLDEELTRTVPKLSPNGTGFLSQREMMRSLGFTSLTVNYLLTKATANRKSPAQIIEELIRKDMTAAV
ncbi:MAG: hypothetical protein LBG93_08560 [Treponema sp.]|jgi:hypothetical protein|nr:hypothetical protein [Treponema sp.]